MHSTWLLDGAELVRADVPRAWDAFCAGEVACHLLFTVVWLEWIRNNAHGGVPSSIYENRRLHQLRPTTPPGQRCNRVKVRLLDHSASSTYPSGLFTCAMKRPSLLGERDTIKAQDRRQEYTP
jgi:hypothetical protein